MKMTTYVGIRESKNGNLYLRVYDAQKDASVLILNREEILAVLREGGALTEDESSLRAEALCAFENVAPDGHTFLNYQLKVRMDLELETAPTEREDILTATVTAVKKAEGLRMAVPKGVEVRRKA